MSVYVVTNYEAGWDCIVGVFSSLETLIDFFLERYEIEEGSDEETKVKQFNLQELENYISNSTYIIFEKKVI